MSGLCKELEVWVQEVFAHTRAISNIEYPKLAKLVFDRYRVSCNAINIGRKSQEAIVCKIEDGTVRRKVLPRREGLSICGVMEDHCSRGKRTEVYRNDQHSSQTSQAEGNIDRGFPTT